MSKENLLYEEYENKYLKYNTRAEKILNDFLAEFQGLLAKRYFEINQKYQTDDNQELYKQNINNSDKNHVLDKLIELEYMIIDLKNTNIQLKKRIDKLEKSLLKRSTIQQDSRANAEKLGKLFGSKDISIDDPISSMRGMFAQYKNDDSVDLNSKT